MPDRMDVDSEPLEPVFDVEKGSPLATFFEDEWVRVPPSPSCCPCGFDRSACQFHQRKFTRSPRSSEVNITFPTFPQSDLSDPFAFVPLIPSEQEESDRQQWDQLGESITRPLSAKQAENKSRVFKLLELPMVDDDEDWVLPGCAIGPPPGLPSPANVPSY